MSLWQRLILWLAAKPPEPFEPEGTLPIPQDLFCPGEDTQKLYSGDPPP